MTLLAILVLSAGLSQLELQPGTLFDNRTRQELMFLLAQLAGYRGLLLVVLSVGLVALLFWFVSSRRKVYSLPRRRNETLSVLVQLILFVVALILLRRRQLAGQLDLNIPRISPLSDLSNESLPQSFPLQIPEWLVFLCSMGLVALIAVAFWLIWRNRGEPALTLERLAQEAQTAVDELQDGGDLRSVILRCYSEMCQVLSRQRGIQRDRAMTPREFESRLVELGLPAAPVGRLTLLFEQVRYGARLPDKDAEQQAMDCLAAIVAACILTNAAVVDQPNGVSP
jgi:hypothetical protein